MASKAQAISRKRLTVQRPCVAVVGAGIAGLSAALALVRAGCAVSLLERAAEPGGKLRQQSASGTAIDAGPTVFTLREIFEGVFRDAGTTLDEHISLQPLEVLARHSWSSTETLDLYADTDRSARAIGELSGSTEARGYLRFCADSRRVYETLDGGFLRRADPSLPHLIWQQGIRGLPNLLRLRAFQSLWSRLGEYFGDPRLRQLFGRYATYCGSSPFCAPSTLMLVAHVEQAGVWQVVGGMQRLAAALTSLFCRSGTLRCSTEVTRIHTRGRRVRQLETSTGERLDIDAAVVTCDASAVASGLLGNDVAGALSPPDPSARSLSALTWTGHGSFNGYTPSRHNVFFSEDYEREFESILQYGRPPDRPTVYICAQDRAGEAEPDSGVTEPFLCLINAPANGDSHRYQDPEVSTCLTQALDTLKRCGLELRAQWKASTATTPSDFHRLFPATGGALYGPLTHGWRASFRRPGTHTSIRGLYLAGGSIHPGPGLPMAALSGQHAARCLIQDMGLTYR